MDPKSLASLDPKLRETYEKVMGTPTTAPSPTAPASGNSTPPASRASTLLPGLIKPQTQPSGSAKTPPIPAPVISSVPNIPPPVSPLSAPPSNSTFPNSPTVTPPMATVQAPLQTPDLVTLQATPTGAPLPTQAANGQLGKVIQPLPSPASINKAAATSTNNSSPIIRVLYIIASIVFFAVYTIFWLKILKYPLPFLPF